MRIQKNNFLEEVPNFMPNTNFTTLCYIECEDSYLMLHRVKKEGDMNRDKWLGVGGHFEKGESPEECLLREVREETGLTLLRWRFRGLITFVSDCFPEEYMCLYTADRYEGTIGECREGCLEWIKKDRIGELNLWEGDLIFFKLLRDNQPFFSLKLCYEGERLTEAVLDGKPLRES
ncbi:hydrolase, NUDIX family [Hungatella hathewayi DSM 13479]|mgnify:FL=1|jgi:8-oxo-dGTP diphosphatase|uniref:Hydrolase, NUDIX family n=2 Tax=Hungatella hathewayi TaxID=154046 RepID=D3AFD0_9FIRM|nr:hydrolase, NUDIX family [Hungatella hathewayi DSM 13479]CCZ61753.1 mutator MutT protein [Hungatella hathewayi CAG:224]CUQ49125.1 NUDIX hydrolase [Hungatella hathewayi]